MIKLLAKMLVTLALALFVLEGCSSSKPLKETFSDISFHWAGRLFFDPVDPLPIKQVHLDFGGLRGNSIVIKGEVVRVSDYQSYFEIMDSTGKVTVSLAKTFIVPQKLEKGVMVAVKGTLKNSKRGHPLVEADAFNFRG